MGIVNSLLNEILDGIESDRRYDTAAQSAYKSGRSYVNLTPVETVNTNNSSSAKTTETVSSPNEVRAAARTEPQTDDEEPARFELTSKQMVQGIILSEIIGKPVSKRRGFGRYKY